MRVSKRDIIEVNFELPSGEFKVHPALVISNENVLDTNVFIVSLYPNIN